MVFPDVTVELDLGGVWTDVTSDVLERDGITITRGRSDEGSQVETSRCSLTFRNDSGDYSPRNPSGAHYGILGRNTPIRVSVEGGGRFTGVVSSWPVTWDMSGADVTARVEASGVLRRLSQQSGGPLASTLRRGVDALTTAVGYWPCEDASGSTSLASGLVGHPAIPDVSGSSLAAFDGFASSAPIPTVGTGEWLATIPTYADTGAFQLRMLLAVPAAGLVLGTQLFLMRLSSGSAGYWNLVVDESGGLRLSAFNSSFTQQLHTTGYQPFGVNGKLLWLSVDIEQNGADVDMGIVTLEVGESVATAFYDTLSSETIGRPDNVRINPFDGMGDTAVGHILVRSEVADIQDLADQLNAYAGETAAARLLRLAPEEDVTVALIGTAADTAAMGTQGRRTVLDLMRECAAADLGVLYEPRGTDDLTYRTRVDLYAQEPTLTLDYESGEVSVIESTDDDQQTRNDVTAKRESGSSARAVDEDGTMGTDTIGRYAVETTVNLELDADLPDQASWRLHLGTVDEARYPRLGVNLAAPAFTSDAGQTVAAVALDLGDTIRVTNPPAWLPPDNIEQIVQGLTETVRPGAWTIEATCTPARPWDVGVLDDATGPGEFRLDSETSALDAAATSTATSLSVAITDGSLWSDADQPFDLNIGGERITVTAISGASSPQTFTVTRSVNGVAKAHDAGATVSLFKPAYLAL